MWVLKQWDGAVGSCKAASQELCSLQISLGEGNYQSFCPGKELKLSMPWQPRHSISHGGSGQANSVSAPLDRFRCRQLLSKIETFIHLGVPFLPNFVCFVRGKKRSQPNSSYRVGTQHDSLESLLDFTEKFQRRRKTPTISQLLRKAGEHYIEHEARHAVGQRSSKMFPWIFVSETSKIGARLHFGRVFWE